MAVPSAFASCLTGPEIFMRNEGRGRWHARDRPSDRGRLPGEDLEEQAGVGVPAGLDDAHCFGGLMLESARAMAFVPATDLGSPRGNSLTIVREWTPSWSARSAGSTGP
jgi:hypothetical protein